MIITIDTIAENAQAIWSEWRAANLGIPAIAKLPDIAPPVDPDSPDWGDCADWHNRFAEYKGMSNDQLSEMVFQHRLSCCFGDGLNEDYARDGGCTIGDPIAEMSRTDMIAELMGDDPPCAHQNSHETDSTTYMRHCNSCGRDFVCDPYGPWQEDSDEPLFERWQLADAFIRQLGDRDEQFVLQIREMLDTRTLEQLRILVPNHSQERT